MRIWFDTEFLEYGDGRLPELISIGLVRDDGATFYAETPDARALCNKSEWHVTNVLPGLNGNVRPSWEITQRVIAFAGRNPEFWAYYGATDWMLLLHLVGGFLNRPDTWPGWCRELKQLISQCGNPRVPKQTYGEHNALADARWNRSVWVTMHAINHKAAEA